MFQSTNMSILRSSFGESFFLTFYYSILILQRCFRRLASIFCQRQYAETRDDIVWKSRVTLLLSICWGISKANSNSNLMELYFQHTWKRMKRIKCMKQLKVQVDRVGPDPALAIISFHNHWWLPVYVTKWEEGKHPDHWQDKRRIWWKRGLDVLCVP